MKRLRTIVHAKFRRRVLGIVLWSVLALTLLDLVVGKATRIPEVSRAIPTTQQAYFDYGRSIEGKLRRMVGANEAQDAPIVGIGWISRDCSGSIPFPVGKLGVAIYGNSFTNRIADQLDELDSRLAIQRLVGPGASPNHSYACFVHRGETATEDAPVQIIGVLGSSLRRMLTVSGLTTSFEYPQPFTYPRFTLGPDGHLIPHWPSIRSPDELRSALHDDEKWRSFLFELASLDDFYTSTMMSADFADHSVLLRMLRRAWGQRALRNRTASLHPEAGFDGAPELTAVLRSILIDFARRARAAGQLPIVVLIEERGYGGVLPALLGSTLRENQIEFVATGDIASTDNPHNFVPDGHFTSPVFVEIARTILHIINRSSIVN